MVGLLLFLCAEVGRWSTIANDLIGLSLYSFIEEIPPFMWIEVVPPEKTAVIYEAALPDSEKITV